MRLRDRATVWAGAAGHNMKNVRAQTEQQGTGGKHYKDTKLRLLTLTWLYSQSGFSKKNPEIKIILFYFSFQSPVIYGWFYLNSPVNHPLRILGLKFQICVNYCKCQVSNLTVKPQIIEIIASVSPVYTTCETQSSVILSVADRSHQF